MIVFGLCYLAFRLAMDEEEKKETCNRALEPYPSIIFYPFSISRGNLHSSSTSQNALIVFIFRLNTEPSPGRRYKLSN